MTYTYDDAVRFAVMAVRSMRFNSWTEHLAKLDSQLEIWLARLEPR